MKILEPYPETVLDPPIIKTLWALQRTYSVQNRLGRSIATSRFDQRRTATASEFWRWGGVNQ